MKTALKRNRNLAAWISIMVFMVMVACVLPGQSQNSTPDTEISPANPTLEATAENMKPTQSSPLEENKQDNCLAGIFPGKTIKEEVVTLLGEPVAAYQEGSYEALQYPTSLRGQYITVYLLNQVVDSISVVLTEDDNQTWSEIKGQYGEPAHTAQSDYLEGSFNLVFPEQGLNFIANPDLDVVFIRECFTPMSLESYLRVYGDFLPQENPFTK